MFAISPSSAFAEAHSESRNSGAGMELRQWARPWVLASLALALVVGAWGYGYKLSQYIQHSGVTKASATRMWVDHRDQGLAAVSPHHSAPHKVPAAQACAVSTFPHLNFYNEISVTASASAQRPFLYFALLPFRAPPASTPSLA